MFPNRAYLLLPALIAAMAVQTEEGSAAIIELFDSSVAVSTTAEPGNATTGLLFQVNSAVEINGFGAFINITSDLVGQPPYNQSSLPAWWYFYKSNLSGGLEGICCTLQKSVSYPTNGLDVYSTTFAPIQLDPGIYTLRLSTQGGVPYEFVGRPEAASLPYNTTDGFFTVLDGSASNAGGIYNDYSTTDLPSFYISTVDPLDIDEPTTLALLTSGIIGLTLLGRRRRDVNPKLSERTA